MFVLYPVNAQTKCTNAFKMKVQGSSFKVLQTYTTKPLSSEKSQKKY